jgi:hypothetical protein
MFTLRGSIGIFRYSDGWARVRYPDGREFDMTKARYVASKRSLPFAALPIKEAFTQPERSRPLGSPGLTE